MWSRLEIRMKGVVISNSVVEVVTLEGKPEGVEGLTVNT